MSTIIKQATDMMLKNNVTLFKTILETEDFLIVKELSEKFGFSIDDALEHLSLNKIQVKTSGSPKTSVKSSAKIPLPFCGVKLNSCGAIRLNHGLYTQCTNSGSESIDGYEGTLCKTCKKQAQTNSNNRPTYGYVEDRLKLGNDYKDTKGKEPVRYANIMEKLNISRNEAERAAENLGLVIAEIEFVPIRKTRGRPKKHSNVVDDTSGSDTESVKSVTTNGQEKKGRGRPKKVKQEVQKLDDDEENSDVEEAKIDVEEAKIDVEEAKIDVEEAKIDVEEKSDVEEAKSDVEEKSDVKEVKKEKDVKKEKKEKKEKDVKKEKKEKKEKDVKKEKKEKKEKDVKKEKKEKKEKDRKKDSESNDVDNELADQELSCSAYEAETDDETEISVKKITLKGKEYLMADNKTLFNPKSHEQVGRLVGDRIEYDSDYDADED
jgi:hypothetical protein